MAAETVRVCVCVDDFGLHPGINDAALALAALGRVHAVSCMVFGPAWGKGWSSPLRRLADDGIEIGLHLDFTEWPSCDASRRSLLSLVVASLLRRLDAARVRAEIHAQLDAFEHELGRAPAFVDGHQHVHQLAGIGEELLDELARRYPGSKPWLRSTRAPGGDARLPALKPRIIEMLGARGFASRAHRMGFAQNRRLLGVYDFSGGPERYRRLLAGWLRAAGDADLLMCHPSTRAQPGAHDAIGVARDSEFAVLTGDRFDDLVRDAGITLAPMRTILEARPATT